MKYTTIFFLLLIALSASAQNPIIVTMPSSIELGTMEQHQIKKETIVIRNAGDAPLKINDIETTCGCTAADPEKNLLAPDEATMMNITFDSKTFEGKQTKYIKIFSNDPKRPVIDIPLEVFVHVPIIVVPKNKYVGFGEVKFGEHPVESVTLKSMDVEDLDVTVLKCDDTYFSVEIDESYGSSDAEIKINISLNENIPIGNFREIVRIGTNVADQPTIDFEVSGTNVDAISLRPNSVNFRYVHKNKLMKKTFIIEPTVPDLSINVLKADIDLTGFSVSKIEPTPNGKGSLVTIQGYPLKTRNQEAIDANGRMKGVLTIYTDYEPKPVLTANVKYLLKI